MDTKAALDQIAQLMKEQNRRRVQMNNFTRAHNKYLDPPDPDPVCEDGCGETLQRDITGEWVCINKYCPLRFDEGTTEREMAELLIGAQEEVRSLARRLRNSASARLEE